MRKETMRKYVLHFKFVLPFINTSGLWNSDLFTFEAMRFDEFFSPQISERINYNFNAKHFHDFFVSLK